MRRRKLQCPYCDNLLRPPIDINIKTLDITGGMCPCSAVYVLDNTGHNLGAKFMDALTFVCRGDIDKALSLMPEDYETHVLDYDIHTNTISVREDKSRKSAKLFFIKLMK